MSESKNSIHVDDVTAIHAVKKKNLFFFFFLAAFSLATSEEAVFQQKHVAQGITVYWDW
jgi:hypothetical protein